MDNFHSIIYSTFGFVAASIAVMGAFMQLSDGQIGTQVAQGRFSPAVSTAKNQLAAAASSPAAAQGQGVGPFGFGMGFGMGNGMGAIGANRALSSPMTSPGSAAAPGAAASMGGPGASASMGGPATADPAGKGADDNDARKGKNDPDGKGADGRLKPPDSSASSESGDKPKKGLLSSALSGTKSFLKKTSDAIDDVRYGKKGSQERAVNDEIKAEKEKQKADKEAKKRLEKKVKVWEKKGKQAEKAMEKNAARAAKKRIELNNLKRKRR